MDKLLLFLLVHFTCSSKADMFKKTPFSFDSEANYNCPQSGKLPYMLTDMLLETLNASRVSATGGVSMDRAFTNKMTLSLELKQWLNDQWETKIAKVDKDQACTSVNLLLGKPFQNVCRAAGIPPGKCPISKGTYRVVNFIVDIGAVPVLKMLSGRFKIILQLRINRTPLFCSEHIFKITQ
ncbi:hypothetical protein CBL_04346 [Carabus blaptoides fortunei]